MNYDDRKIRAKLQPYINALASPLFIESTSDYYLIQPELILNHAKDLGKLLDSWGLDTDDDPADNIDWFVEEGHRASFRHNCNTLARMKESERNPFIASIKDDALARHKLEIAHQYLQRMPSGGIAAFDYSWIVFKCCAGFTLGYLTESDKWRYIAQVYDMLEKSYSNSHDYMLGFAVGCIYNSSNLSSDYVRRNKAAIHKLLSSKQSPLNRVDIWRS
ncbi:DUF1266 domain-containing protein [Paenibacillus oenotherae]|uniref:DUF1266 domain-containing protein n=1 Tax=Paenibacillus oenotherae TaxID=1435645 RepID=A0ABS7DC99_9BACL|nr:DUF1266 domain-containing protein [Paenibacillus oenotherae]MBW7477557.1 DUF1266 domain-containing protein [Paenibacillus oenotherae]